MEEPPKKTEEELGVEISRLEDKYLITQRAVRDVLSQISGAEAVNPEAGTLLGWRLVSYDHEQQFYHLDLERRGVELGIRDPNETEDQPILEDLDKAIAGGLAGDYRAMKDSIREIGEDISLVNNYELGDEEYDSEGEARDKAKLAELVEMIPDSGPNLSPVTPAILDPKYNPALREVD